MAYKNKKLNIFERTYISEILRGLGITIKHFFSKKVTMQYPEEKWEVPEGYRGLPKLVMGDDGVEKCVACKLCERACPSEAITIEIGEYRDQNKRERVPAQFTIDMGRCIVCGFCEEACPVDAIIMSKEHEFARGSREELIFTKEILLDDYAKLITQYEEKTNPKKKKRTA